MVSLTEGGGPVHVRATLAVQSNDHTTRNVSTAGSGSVKYLRACGPSRGGRGRGSAGESGEGLDPLFRSDSKKRLLYFSIPFSFFSSLGDPAATAGGEMAWWARMVSPARRICDGVACRLGFRKSGEFFARSPT